MLGIILQIVCAVMGAAAIILVGCKKHSVCRLGYLLGCLNAPMWIAVAVNIFYIAGWCYGLKNHWKGDLK